MAVRDSVRSVTLNEWDYDGVFNRVLSAADMWLLPDLKAQEMRTEQPIDNVVKMVLDLVLVHSPENCGIVDWKTTGSLKRPNYVEETKSEFQTSFYLSYGGDWIEENFGVRPQWIEYRVLDEEGQLRSFRVEASLKDRDNAVHQIDSVAAAYESLRDYQVWPRNRPRACFIGSKSGPTCPYYRDCCDMTMPLVHINKFEDCVPRSKSSIGTFLRCNELYRREKLVEGVPGTSPEKSIGVAFHLGVQRVWEMAWNFVKGIK